MENVSNVDKVESIQSYSQQSVNLKMHFLNKGANTTLVKKRLKAVCIG